MARTPGPITGSAGDQGGPLTNGGVHTGEIVRGDLDVWTFTATVGDRIAVHIGEIADPLDFRPWIRLWGPTGTSLGASFGLAAAQIGDVLAPVTGTYLVLVASADSGVDDGGTYQLTMTHTPGPITVSPGDEGGPIGSGSTQSGVIGRGDLDVWSFTATAGAPLTVQIAQTGETDDFRPWIRLWTPAGATVGSSFGLDTAQIGPVVAPVTGTYLVLVASADSGVDGVGTYNLTVTGGSSVARLRSPHLNGSPPDGDVRSGSAAQAADGTAGVLRFAGATGDARMSRRLREHGRDVRERVVQRPHEKEHEWDVHDELQHRVADDVASFEAEDADERQHPEGVDQVRERLGGVIGLHHPTQVDLQRLRGLEHVWRFDQPLAAG
jgi:hypothetical protein